MAKTIRYTCFIAAVDDYKLLNCRKEKVVDNNNTRNNNNYTRTNK